MRNFERRQQICTSGGTRIVLGSEEFEKAATNIEYTSEGTQIILGSEDFEQATTNLDSVRNIT